MSRLIIGDGDGNFTGKASMDSCALARKKKKRTVGTSIIRDDERRLEQRGPRGYGAPTPQRIAMANEKHSGRQLRASSICTEKGNPTGEYFWRVSPIIDELEKRGTIDRQDWHVATRYMCHYVGSHGRGPATSKMLPYYDKSFQVLSPPERAIAFGQAVAAARQAVHPFGHPVLDWLEASCGDEEPLWRLGEVYYPGLSRSQQSAKAPAMLHTTLAMLADHYGMQHRWATIIVVAS